METLYTIIASAIISTIFSSIFGVWLSTHIRASIQSEYDQKLQTHKASLDSQNNLNLQTMRNEFELKSKIIEIEKGWGHQKMAEALCELHDSLHTYKGKINDYVTIFQGEEYTDPTRYQMAIEAFNEFKNAYLKKRILIPDSIAEKIESFVMQLQDQARRYNSQVARRHTSVGSGDIWNEIDKFVREDGDKIIRSLETESKKIMGINQIEIHQPVTTPPVKSL